MMREVSGIASTEYESLASMRPSKSECRAPSENDAEVTASKITPEPSVRRAVVLMTMTSFMVPFGGIIISPILAQGLGVAGRGEVAAAIAPNSLLVAVATIGLPEALTYYLAKHPQISRSALALATACSLAFGII
jgi:hypothetical protein